MQLYNKSADPDTCILYLPTYLTCALAYDRLIVGTLLLFVSNHQYLPRKFTREMMSTITSTAATPITVSALPTGNESTSTMPVLAPLAPLAGQTNPAPMPTLTGNPEPSTSNDRSLKRQSSKSFSAVIGKDKGKEKEATESQPEAGTSITPTLAPDEREAFDLIGMTPPPSNETAGACRARVNENLYRIALHGFRLQKQIDTHFTILREELRDGAEVIGSIHESIASAVTKAVTSIPLPTATMPSTLAGFEEFRDMHTALSGTMVNVTEIRNSLDELHATLRNRTQPTLPTPAPMPLPTLLAEQQQPWVTGTTKRVMEEYTYPDAKKQNRVIDSPDVLVEGSQARVSESPASNARSIIQQFSGTVHTGMLAAAYRVSNAPHEHVVLRFKSAANASFFAFTFQEHCPPFLVGARATVVSRANQSNITMFENIVNARSNFAGRGSGLTSQQPSTSMGPYPGCASLPVIVSAPTAMYHMPRPSM
ncbi:hypothetical protein F5051DRAFT_393124 [Lentinula edodes]|nr:hypothetical protein F5051DRAFT_393124 [Lentinula edodes]